MRIKPRVCIVLPHLYPLLARGSGIEFAGGAEVQHAIAARSLVQAGFEVSAIILDYGQADGQVCDGIVTRKSHTPQGGIPVLRFFYPRLFRTWTALKRADADIYLQPCAGYLTGVVAAYCRLAGRKSVFVGASDTDFIPEQLRLGSRRDRAFFRWGMRNVDGVIAQTPKQQELCRRHYERDAAVIPNGYEAPAPTVANRREYVLWVGSIRPVKRPDRFLAIARSLPEYRFRMIGGPIDAGAESLAYYQKIKSEAESISNLELLGFLPFEQAERHFNNAALFINTSEVEGFPNTFLQAWARGIPTVSMFDPQLPEADVFRRAGDVVEAVAAIRELLGSDGAWDTSSARCRDYFVHNHSVRENVVRYERFFAELMEA